MFRRKLTSLDYHNPGVDARDVQEFRQLVLWLEDQKVRHYKIEDRAGLRAVGDDSVWPGALQSYLVDLGSPHSDASQPTAILDWLLGYAVRLEYGDNREKYQAAAVPNSAAGGAPKSSNPLDNMEFSDPDFKAGVASLVSFLQIPPHPDPLTQLKAVCLLIRDKLSKAEVERLTKEGYKTHAAVPLDKLDLGFDTTDYISTEAAKVLRLLHLNELRDLQDGVNQAIVAVQGLTANPKTDSRLGKVGRM